MNNLSSQVDSPPVRPVIQTDQNILMVAKGGSIVFAGKLFEYSSRFVIVILLTRILGAEQFGLYNLALTAATIASGLASLGLTSALVRFIALYRSRRDTAGLWGTLQVGLGLTTLSSIFTGALLYILAQPIAVELFHEPRLISLLQLMSMAIPFLTLGDIIAAATRGFKQMQYTVLTRNIAQPSIRVALTAMVALVGLNVANALWVFILSAVVGCLMLIYFLNKLFALKRPLTMGQRRPKEILNFAWPVYLSGLITTFGGNIQTMLLGGLNTLSSVGIFVVASQLNILGQMFHEAIFTAAAPIISELHDRQDRVQLGYFYQLTTKWTFTMNLPFFLILVLFPEPILSIFGHSFVGGATALIILAWANLVDTGTGICGTVLDMSGNTLLKLINSGVTFGLTVGLNIWLIPLFGLVGAAIALLVASTFINLVRVLEVFFLFRLLPYNKGMLKPITAGLVTLAIISAILWLFPGETNVLYTAVNIVILIVTYIGVILLLGLSQDDRMILGRMSQRVTAIWSR